MKKLFFYAALFAAGFAVTSCSSDKDVVVDENQTIKSGGDNYISLDINLPTVPASTTRANDIFDDGLASEYAVKDAYLLIFGEIPSGKTEDDAEFKEWHKINIQPMSDATDAPNQVTQYSRKVVTKVGNNISANNLMLVLLNVEGNGIVSTSGSIMTLAGTALSNQKYSVVRALPIAQSTLGASSMTTDGFFMANAVLADKPGTVTSKGTDYDDVKFRTLVPISAVYDTEAAAAAADADQIYVERGMAKVTVNELSGSFKLSGTGVTTYGAEILGWTLDNTNTTSYVVKSTDFTDTYGSTDLHFKELVNQKEGSLYRFMGGAAIAFGTPGDFKYRTYFAKDPNYNTDATLTAGYQDTGSNYKAASTSSESYPQYCLENTFDVAHQNENQTTLVRLKVQSKTSSAEDLFELNGTKSTIYTRSDIDSHVKNIAVTYLQEKGLAAASTADFADYTDGENTVHTATYGGSDLKDAEITLQIGNGSGLSTKYSAYLASDGKTLNSATLTAIRNRFAETYGKIAYYADGISYYTIRIKHFGDHPYCNWVKGENGVAVGSVYPGVSSATAADKVQCAKNWLGRYGVLRNNWYDISVKTIKYLGDPAPEIPGDTTDDELDTYISFQINILSWAKRTQSADL